ncbi:MAG: AraC family transcriptional regulator ligand-binding domain-containing protein [Hyphomicrobiales bacterium]|nr:AraC family transcriptional regulator ligand-binding domain-containing protein [Hyphomicrobiales bacterium]
MPALLSEFGVEIEAVLEGTGLGVEDLRPEAMIPFAQAQLILDRAALLTGRDDFGLQMGLRQGLEALGPVGSIMRHAATLGNALSDFVGLQLGNSGGAAVYLLRSADHAVFGYGVYDSSGHASPQIYDLALAVGCNIVKELTDGAVGPSELWSVRRKPSDLSPYMSLGHCPIRFEQSQTCLFLPGRSIGHELPLADPSFHRSAIAEIMAQRARVPWDTAHQVRNVFRSQLVAGRTTMPDVAKRLGLHPRSLRRALQRENATFDTIKDDVRYAVARELLALTSLSIVDIGMALDFATPSAFVRAFRRWSGVTPGIWRKERE